MLIAHRKVCAVSVWLVATSLLVGCDRTQPDSAEFDQAHADTSSVDQVEKVISKIRTTIARNPRSSEAFTALKQLNTKHPNNSDVRELLTSMLIQLEDWEGCLAVLRAIPESSRKPSYDLEFATMQMKAGHYHEAFDLVNGRVDESGRSDSQQTAWLAAFAGFQIGELERAAVILDANRELFEEAGHKDCALIRGMIHMHEGELDKAETELKLAVREMPNLPNAHDALGRVLNAQHKSEAAKTQLSQAAKLRKAADNRIQLQLTLSAAAKALESAFRRKDYEACEKHIATLMPHTPPKNQAALFNYLASIRSAQGKSKEAQEAAAQARKLLESQAPPRQD